MLNVPFIHNTSEGNRSSYVAHVILPSAKSSKISSANRFTGCSGRFAIYTICLSDLGVKMSERHEKQAYRQKMS